MPPWVTAKRTVGTLIPSTVAVNHETAAADVKTAGAGDYSPIARARVGHRRRPPWRPRKGGPRLPKPIAQEHALFDISVAYTRRRQPGRVGAATLRRNPATKGSAHEQAAVVLDDLAPSQRQDTGQGPVRGVQSRHLGENALRASKPSVRCARRTPTDATGRPTGPARRVCRWPGPRPDAGIDGTPRAAPRRRSPRRRVPRPSPCRKAGQRADPPRTRDSWS